MTYKIQTNRKSSGRTSGEAFCGRTQIFDSGIISHISYCRGKTDKITRRLLCARGPAALQLS